MKISLLCVGKTDVGFVNTANDIYLKRLKHYIPVELDIIPENKVWKKMSANDRKIAEGKAILSQIKPGDKLVLLDEKGKQYTSEKFADLLQQDMNAGVKRLVFVVGGAFGFSQEVYSAAQGKLSLSEMTFSHQMIRCFMLEQIYRAMTILKNEPYHNR